MLYVIIVVLVSGLVALIVYSIDKRKRSDKEYTDYFMDKMMANMLYYKNFMLHPKSWTGGLGENLLCCRYNNVGG